MTCNCDICQRQHAEEKCIKRICSYFDWTFDRAPNEDASDYEYCMHTQWEYIALTHSRSWIRCWSSKYGSGSCQWFVFKDFLEWLSRSEFFAPADYIPPNFDFTHYVGNEIIATVSNPFYGRCMTTVEEVNIAFDLIAAV